jgi:hypothetical protein
MAAIATKPTQESLYVIHPLDDVQEQKCSTVGLGLMELTPIVRLSLTALRVYLIAMTIVILYRTLSLTHLFHHVR